MRDTAHTPESQYVNGSDVPHNPMNMTIKRATTLSATKTFRPGDDRGEYGGTFKRSTWDLVTIHDLEHLWTVLRWCAPQHRVYVVPGHPTSAATRGLPVLRTSIQPGATLMAVPRGWFAFDIDKMELPDGCDIRVNPDACIAYAISQLCVFAPELRGARLIVQLSSSAGIKPGSRTISMHVWGLLSVPIMLGQIKRWAAGVNTHAGYKLIDTAPLSSAERIFFTADPQFIEGRESPIPERWFRTEGERDHVSLDIPEETEEARAKRKAEYRSIDWQGASAEIGGVDGFRIPIMKAIRAHICAGRPDEDAFYEGLQWQIFAAPDGGRSPKAITEYASLKELHRMRDHYVLKWGRIVAGEDAVRAAGRGGWGSDTARAHIPLPLARDVLQATAESAAGRIETGEVVNEAAAVTVGGGKTTAFIRVFAAAGVLVDAFSPTSKLQDELAARHADLVPQAPTPLVMRGRKYPEMCIHGDDAELMSQAGSPIPGTLCVGCPKAPVFEDGERTNPGSCAYLAQSDGIELQPFVIATHGHLAGREPKEGYPVGWHKDRQANVAVVDEAIHGAVFEDVIFNLADYSPDDLDIMLTPPKKRKAEVSDAVRNLAKKVALAVLDGKHLLDEPIDYVSPVVDSFLTPGNLWAAIGTFTKCRPMDVRGDSRNKISVKSKLKLKKSIEREKLLRLLEHVRDGFSNLTRSATVNGTFVVTFFNKPQIHASTSIVALDGTLNVDLLNAIYGRTFNVTKLKIKQHLELSRITGMSGSMASFFGRADARVEFDDASEDDQKKETMHIVRLLGMIDTYARGRKTLVVGQKRIIDAMKDYTSAGPHMVCGGGEIAFHHFNSLRGVNEFEDYWGVVILGYQQIALDVAERQRACLPGHPTTMAAWSAQYPDVHIHLDGYLRHPDTGAALHPDPLTEAIRWNSCEGELVQCIGRLRAVQEHRTLNPVRLLVVGDMYIPDLPEPVRTWDWDKALQHGIEGPALRRYVERELATHTLAPLGKREMIQRAPDLFANEGAARNALKVPDVIPAGVVHFRYRFGPGPFSKGVCRDQQWQNMALLMDVNAMILHHAFGSWPEVVHYQGIEF